MGAGSVKWVLSVALCALFRSAGCNSVEQKIYVDLNNTIPCVRLLNGTHQMGCQSSISGNTGVLHVLETEADLDWVLKSGPHPPYMVLMDASYFNSTVMMQLKNSTRVTGVAVVIPSTGPPQGFSPHNKCPNQHTGVYSDSYGPGLADCNVTVWNPLGNGLSFEDFKFPIFSLKDDNQTEAIRKCISDHNVGNNGSAPAYPLCAMQMFSHMHAVTSTATCMRRNYIQEHYSLNPESVCDPLGDFNVWAPLLPLNVTSKGHKANESVVIAATRLDGRSFFWDVATAAEGTVTGFVTLLAAAHALRSVTEQAPPSRNILFTFFQGETFDYIGSSRMVYDMEKKKFVIDLDNVHSVLEIGQVGLREGTNLWMHTDPVSRTNASVDEQVRNLVANLKDSVTGLGINLAEPTVSQPLPPSSFQRFLRARPFPGVVLADHQSSFVNKYYESIYDNAAYLNVTYPSDLSPEEQLEYITDTAKALAQVATLVARTLYRQADGNKDLVDNITADAKIVTQMLYGFLIRTNNSWFRSMISAEDVGVVGSQTPQYYVGVSVSMTRPSPMTRLVQYLLANLTGTVTALNQTTCQDPSSQRNESKELYSYLWVRGPQSANSTNRDPYCVRSTVRSTLAISPAFELREYESKVYSTWTESRWKSSIKARIFLVASKELEMLTLGVGIAVLLVSLLVTYFISSKAELLFSSTREPSGTTY
ncbi:nicastrin [Denticeps clupeoides]|uniref:Nicastrin n=1 Tax=Denticeps clupeoides TaxID=299321 RepID=A0AAY4BVL9_9TELE|nr:nicastrin [Denticeps clupeoides]